MGEPRRVLIDGALLQEAEALGLAVGLHSSRGRIAPLYRETADDGANQDEEFVDSYNRHIDEHGVAGDEYHRYG